MVEKTEKQKKKHEKEMHKLMKKIVKDERKHAPPHDTLKRIESHAVKLDSDIQPISTHMTPEPKHPAQERALAKKTKQEIAQAKKEKRKRKRKETKMRPHVMFILFLVLMLVVSTVMFLYTQNVLQSFLLFAGALLAFAAYLVMRKRFEIYSRTKKMELVFPDFISLMASNLRAGMTIDRALLASGRKEFAPLDTEIIQVGKDILTGREITEALRDMARRIQSDEIRKTLQLIISGMRSGGNLSILLEHTSNNMRERMFVKKRAASNVLMYVIFIFFAVAIGAPLLFALSNVLVGIMTDLFSNVGVENVNVNLPFTLTEINISSDFVFYFSIAFIIVSAFLASLILGLVSKGEEKEGFKYTFVLIVLALLVFLLSRTFLNRYFVNFFG